jgi:hypothetical protein
MNSLRKKLLILSCFASLVHCQMGYAGYFDAFSSYATNSYNAMKDASYALFTTVCEHPRISAAILGATSLMGSFTAYALIQKSRQHEPINFLINNSKIEILPKQINDPEPLNNIFVIRQEMLKEGFINQEEFELLQRSGGRTLVVREIPKFEAVLIETSDVEDNKKIEFRKRINEYMKNNRL